MCVLVGVWLYLSLRSPSVHLPPVSLLSYVIFFPQPKSYCFLSRVYNYIRFPVTFLSRRKCILFAISIACVLGSFTTSVIHVFVVYFVVFTHHFSSVRFLSINNEKNKQTNERAHPSPCHYGSASYLRQPATNQPITNKHWPDVMKM